MLLKAGQAMTTQAFCAKRAPHGRLVECGSATRCAQMRWEIRARGDRADAAASTRPETPWLRLSIPLAMNAPPRMADGAANADADRRRFPAMPTIDIRPSPIAMTTMPSVIERMPAVAAAAAMPNGRGDSAAAPARVRSSPSAPGAASPAAATRWRIARKMTNTPANMPITKTNANNSCSGSIETPHSLGKIRLASTPYCFSETKSIGRPL